MDYLEYLLHTAVVLTLQFQQLSYNRTHIFHNLVGGFNLPQTIIALVSIYLANEKIVVVIMQ